MQEVIPVFQSKNRHKSLVKGQIASPFFELNDKQKEARALIVDNPDAECFLFLGGARSGKTFSSVYFCVQRSRMFPRSRHLICRLRFNHAKASIWMDTLPKVLRLLGLRPKKDYHLNRTDFVVYFNNGSELWVDGLDNAERVEKMLGREYNTIYFNEISQISYDSVTTMISRLALKSYSEEWGECRNYYICDCNPSTKRHWSYQLWFLQRDPETKDPLPQDQLHKYKKLKMNPQDNLMNLSTGYIDKLKSLPERKRKRFLDGDYSDVEGAIFNNWAVIPFVPEEVKRQGMCRLGLDFGFTADCAAAVRIWYIKRKVDRSKLYIEELVYEKGLTNKMLMRAVHKALLHLDKEASYRQYAKDGGELTFQEWDLEGLFTASEETTKGLCDGASPKDVYELQEIVAQEQWPYQIVGVKNKTEILTGIDWLEDLDIYIVEESENVIEEFEGYEWKKDEEGQATPVPIDKNNHAIDAIRYACHDWIGQGNVQIVPLGAY